MIRRALLTLALIGTAGMAGAQAQQVISSPPQPSPGDYQRQAPGPQPGNPMDQQAQMMSSGACGHQDTMRDEYGFRYDSQGNRLNARGCVIAPPISRP